MKKFAISLIVLFIIMSSIAALVFFGLGFYLSPQSNLQKADAIVVVSGGQTTTRAQKGIELFKDNMAKNLILSGAALDDGPSNATAMAVQATASGVPYYAIYTDPDSQNTYENAKNTKLILESIDAKSIILVTSPYHQRRTYETFRSVLGHDYVIQNASSVDNRWSKSQWYKTEFGRDISISELQKMIYIYVTGNYQ